MDKPLSYYTPDGAYHEAYLSDLIDAVKTKITGQITTDQDNSQPSSGTTAS